MSDSLPPIPPIPSLSGQSTQDGHAYAASMDLTAALELRVNSSSVGLYSEAPPTISDDALATTAMTPSTISPAPPFIRLLSGPLGDFLRYSRQEASQWLIDIAHDICDPADLRGSLLVWKEPQQDWCPVASTDPLTASVYRYDLPRRITVGLSKISSRAGESVTAETGNASTMASRVEQRDGECWLSGVSQPIVNSRICPKRMGDHLARIIFTTFTSTAAPPNLSVYDEVFGLNLSANLDAYFNEYEMGLRSSSLNTYEAHVFATEEADKVLTFAGRMKKSKNVYGYPAIHGLHASPPRPRSDNLPPPGLFRWHYLQCVLKRFAHDDYKDLPNIYFPELPFRMKGDSDDEGTDSEADWPSKALDLGRELETRTKEDKEHQEAVSQWVLSTS